MALKNLWTKTSKWLRNQDLGGFADNNAQVGSDGLINAESNTQSPTGESQAGQKNEVVVKTTAGAMDKTQSLEKMQQSFDKLVDRLQGIHEHLGRQVTQHEDLMSHIEQLPKILESFPAVVGNQSKLTEQLFEQLKTNMLKEQQFVETIEKIPAETAKQTDTLTSVNHQLAAAADIDVQMSEKFKKFNETLNKLDQSTQSQTESILQMSKTFVTSDRYLKYLMSKQNRRFMWIFTVAISVCFAVIVILTGIIIYLKQ